MDPTKSTLVNWIFYPPIGHVIEGLKVATNVKSKYPNMDLAILLNKDSSLDIAHICPVISDVLCVDIEEFEEGNTFRPTYEAIPKQWLNILSYPTNNNDLGNKALNQFHYTFKQDVSAIGIKSEQWDTFIWGPESRVRLVIPDNENNWGAEKVRKLGRDVNFAVLYGPGSNSISRRPDKITWKNILKTIEYHFGFPGIFVFGALSNTKNPTAGVDHSYPRELCEELRYAENMFDVGLLNQLGVIQHCDLFISPHSGFASAVQALKKAIPWLVISGGEWHELFLNRVPFYSVYPSCVQYPCFGGAKNLKMKEECNILKERKNPYECFSEISIKEKIPEIIKGAECLLLEKWDYDKCMQRHRKFLKSAGVTYWD